MSEYFSVVSGSVYKTIKNIKNNNKKTNLKRNLKNPKLKPKPKPPIWKRPSKLKSFFFRKRNRKFVNNNNTNNTNNNLVFQHENPLKKKVSDLSIRINNKLKVDTNLPYYPPRNFDQRY